MSDEPKPIDMAAFVQAVLDIAKDPKAWDARVAEMRKHHAEAQEALEKAAVSEHVALEHRQVAEKALADAASKEASAGRWSKQLEQKVKAVTERDNTISAREIAAKKLEENVRYREGKVGERETTLKHVEIDLANREQAVAEKHAAAEKLLASYDEAKHKAALKLAS